MPYETIISPLLAKWSLQFFFHTFQCITVTRIFLGHDVKGLKIDLFYYGEDVDLFWDNMNNI
jgi:hypothetical protein